MRLALEIVFFAVTLGVLPIVVNKSTEIHLDWMRRWLRELWFGIFAFFIIYWMATKPEIAEGVVGLQKYLYGWFGYALSGALGIIIFCGFWWFTGRIVPSQMAEAAKGQLGTDKVEKQASSPTNRR